MKLFQMRLADMDLTTLRRTALTAAVVALVETPLAMALGAALGYVVGPRAPCHVTVDTAALPVGTVIRVERDKLVVLPRDKVWEGGTHGYTWDGWRWVPEAQQ